MGQESELERTRGLPVQSFNLHLVGVTRGHGLGHSRRKGVAVCHTVAIGARSRLLIVGCLHSGSRATVCHTVSFAAAL